MKYTKPNFDREWSEAQRYSIFKNLGQTKWKQIANRGSEINAKSIITRLSNTTANKVADAEKRFRELEPDKKARVKAALEKKEIELPIVLRTKKGNYALMAGNTRLTSMVAKGIVPKVWLIDLNKINVNEMNEKWTQKYKKSIDCSNPKGFSQKAHCQGRKKTFKEMREFMMTRGFAIGPTDTQKPMASMGSSGQFFPNRKYATTMPALSATYNGPGQGTYKPMVTADKKIKEVSDKLKSKVLQRKIQKAKDKFFKNNKPKSLFNSTTKKD